MSVVRKFYPEVNLKRLLGEPGGITVGSALDRAAQNVATARDGCMKAIGEKVESIHALAAAGDEESLSQCYTLSNEVFALAGAFGAQELSEAAHSLCTVLQKSDRGPRGQAAIAVHVDAMRLLRSPETAGQPALRRAVLTQLSALRAKL